MASSEPPKKCGSTGGGRGTPPEAATASVAEVTPAIVYPAPDSWMIDASPPYTVVTYEQSNPEGDSHGSSATSVVTAAVPARREEGFGSRSSSPAQSPLADPSPSATSTVLDHCGLCQDSGSRLATASICPEALRLPDFEVNFEPGDAENPQSWPPWYKGLSIASLSFASWNVVFYSTSYTAGIPGMIEDFGLANETLATLGVTVYLIGLAVGSLLTAPISEVCGRRPVYIVSLFVSMLLVLPCALATTSFPELIMARFFGALMGGAMVANATGTLADITDQGSRALVFSIWSVGPMNGPITGPVIGGFLYQYLGWRWTNWLALIVAGVAWVAMLLVRETYAPAILRRRAAQRRRDTGDDRWWSRYDQRMPMGQALKVSLLRPFVLAVTEPILWFWNLYIAAVYSILYLCFVAYPLIFGGIRGWSPGLQGLSFGGVCLGTTLAIGLEPLIRRMINAHPKDPETWEVPPEASGSILCIAAVLAPMGQLVFSLTSLPTTIHWAWSIMAGLPFGAGNTLIFIYGSDYITGVYGIYAASALAGNAAIRYIIGGTLPLAGPAMYKALTPRWAGVLLGLIEVLLIPIPFVFYRRGKAIRLRSNIITQMREDQARAEQNSKPSHWPTGSWKNEGGEKAA